MKQILRRIYTTPPGAWALLLTGMAIIVAGLVSMNGVIDWALTWQGSAIQPLTDLVPVFVAIVFVATGVTLEALGAYGIATQLRPVALAITRRIVLEFEAR